MIFFLLSLQSISIFVFIFLVCFKKNVYYFGNIILFFQIIFLFAVIFHRSVGQGFNLFIFSYILLIPLVFQEFAIFSSRKKPSKIKLMFQKFIKNLENNFFNLFIFNVGSFYLSRVIFKEVFLRTSKKLENPYDVIKFFTFLWVCFWLTLTYEICFSTKIYFSAILISVIFLLNRFVFLLLNVSDYFSKECLNYLNSLYSFQRSTEETSRLPFFSNDLFNYFQNKDNLMKIQEEELDETSVRDHWKKCYSGLEFSSCIVRIIIFQKIFQIFSRNTAWISFLLILVGIFLELSRKFSEVFILVLIFLIISIVLFSYNIIFLRINLTDLNEEMKRQVFLKKVLTIFKTNFLKSDLSKEIFDEKLEFPPNRKPYDILHFFERNLIFMNQEDLTWLDLFFSNKLNVFLLVFICLNLVFTIASTTQVHYFFFSELSFFYFLLKIKIFFFLCFN